MVYTLLTTRRRHQQKSIRRCLQILKMALFGMTLEWLVFQHLKPTETRIYILYFFVCVAYYKQIAWIPTDFAICFPKHICGDCGDSLARESVIDRIDHMLLATEAAKPRLAFHHVEQSK